MSEITPKAKLLPGFKTEAEALKRSETAWQEHLAAKHTAAKRPDSKVAAGDITRFLGRVRQKADETDWAMEVRSIDETLLTAEEKTALVVDDVDWQPEDDLKPPKEP